MQNELIIVLVLLIKSMGACADDIAITKISDIPTEIQHCLILAASSEDRSFLKIALDQECYNQFSDEAKHNLFEILKKIEQTNFISSPIITQSK